jgi:hypothetical protein
MKEKLLLAGTNTSSIVREIYILLAVVVLAHNKNLSFFICMAGIKTIFYRRIDLIKYSSTTTTSTTSTTSTSSTSSTTTSTTSNTTGTSKIIVQRTNLVSRPSQQYTHPSGGVFLE